MATEVLALNITVTENGTLVLTNLAAALSKFKGQAQSDGAAAGKGIEQVNVSINSIIPNMQALKVALATIGIPITINAIKDSFTSLVTSAISFESAFAGVKRTFDDTTISGSQTTPQLEAMRTAIQNMSLAMPETATNIAGLVK